MPIGFNRQPDERRKVRGLTLIPDSEDPVNEERGRLVELNSKGLEAVGEYIGTGTGGTIIFGENVVFNGSSVSHAESGFIKPVGDYALRPYSGSSIDEAKDNYVQRILNQISDSQSDK